MTAETEQAPESKPAAPPLLGHRAPAEPHPLKALLVYLFVVFVGGALIAPRFHASAQFLAENYSSFRPLAEVPFHRYVQRCILLLALVGLPIFLKALHIPSARALGLRFSARNWGEAAQGAAWGFAMIAAVAALAVAFQGREAATGYTQVQWSKHVRNTVFAMAFAGVIEELLFRGALFGALRRKYSFRRAALLSAAVYALLHFFERPQDPRSVEWLSGVQMLGEMFSGFVQWEKLIPGFLNLTLLGVILALGFDRTGSLLFCVGLHASVICWMKTLAFLTKPVADANTWAWGSSKIVDGWASGAILLIGFVVLRATLPKPQPNDG